MNRRELSRLIVMGHLLITMLLGTALVTMTAFVVAAMLSGSRTIAIAAGAIVFTWACLMMYAGHNGEEVPE